MTSIRTERLTYETWLAMPETRLRYEIVDGVMLMAPAPTWYHQWIILRLAMLLERFVNERQLGIVLTAPADLIIQREPLRVRQPDILFVNGERTGIRGAADLADLRQPPEVPPDLVVEVLSTSNTRQDTQSKLDDYRQVGALECWLASTDAKTIEVLRLSSEGVASVAVYGIEDTLQSEVPRGSSIALEGHIRLAGGST